MRRNLLNIEFAHLLLCSLNRWRPLVPSQYLVMFLLDMFVLNKFIICRTCTTGPLSLWAAPDPSDPFGFSLLSVSFCSMSYISLNPLPVNDIILFNRTMSEWNCWRYFLTTSKQCLLKHSFGVLEQSICLFNGELWYLVDYFALFPLTSPFNPECQ